MDKGGQHALHEARHDLLPLRPSLAVSLRGPASRRIESHLNEVGKHHPGRLRLPFLF